MTRRYYELVRDDGHCFGGAWLTDAQAARGQEQHGDDIAHYRLAETRYRDDLGREVYVSTGISGQFDRDLVTYAVYWRINDRSHHRVRSNALPIRITHAEAQADLDAYAARKGWARKEALTDDAL